ncbi:hypothetical protein ABIE44_000412 [Marmoricola sp. OAE513]|uniref:hypothetical protein n=1 Tax=Marmoricola sp. OAE513 TaxID=2817894 RepID=UPI001AE9DAF9
MIENDDEDFSSDDPIVRALRAPGTPDELAGERDFVAAFAAQRHHGSVRRIFSRVGVGATTAVAAVALSTGVAAAYTGGLPDPVQELAHDVLGPVGVPAPDPVRPPVVSRTPERTAGASPTAGATGPTATPTPTASATEPSAPGSTATASSLPTTSAPPTAPIGAPTPTASSSTGATVPPVRRVPAAVSIEVSDRRVPADTPVTVTGVVTAEDGHRLRKRSVRLMARVGKQRWTQVAAAKTDRRGQVAITSPALARTSELRLATANKVRSNAVRVVVVPVVTASSTNEGGTTTITVSVRGARAGDAVAVLRRKDGTYVRLTQAGLDADGTAVLTVPTPRRQVRLVVRVLSTPQHPSAQTSLRVGPEAG